MKKKIQRYLSGERDGFSLVELIIVIAIMAILIGVVALVVLPYLESARENRDRQTLADVSSAFKSAMSNEGIASSTEAAGLPTTKAAAAALPDTIKEKLETYLEGDLKTAADSLSAENTKGGTFVFAIVDDIYYVAIKAGDGADGKDDNGHALDSDGKPFENMDATSAPTE